VDHVSICLSVGISERVTTWVVISGKEKEITIILLVNGIDRVDGTNTVVEMLL
jgi:hypothetical protein